MVENRTYRIRTQVGNEPNVLNVQMSQDYDLFEILSLKLTQEDAYKLYQSSYGVIVGRVLANGGFGVPNAKISIFIPIEDVDKDNVAIEYLYPYATSSEANYDGIRYNLLPDEKVNNCHQNVGTFPNKRLLLDNDTVLDVFDKYWKYTTVSNEAGDYMLFGVPTGNHTLHVDIDLSDIGVLSQRPRDMIYKGYDVNLFESPNKFKQSENLNSLSQIYSQDIGVNVYSFWGDTEDADTNAAITRADIKLDYLFEPTCVFMGSIVTDSGSNAIGKNCTPTTSAGKMDELITGEGSIEMIRKTLNGGVEEFQIKGNRLINGDGVWCYQIPMNLDYVGTDEYGNIVQTDDPTKGIPTRARVRFRISLDDSPNDATARKRCKLLVPNNPRLDEDNYPQFTKTKEADFEFGTSTREESYKDLFWNKVYSVKSYIPRMQSSTSAKNRNHSGIKMVNHYGNNNPIPYNNVGIKLGFTYRMICILASFIITLVELLNIIISVIGILPCLLWKIKLPIIGRPFGFVKAAIPTCVRLTSGFCDDDINKITYYPGCTGCVWDLTQEKHEDENKDYINNGDPDSATKASNTMSGIKTCVETELANDNEVASFNFFDDWINGMLYAPMWYRKITPKKSFLFGLFKRRAKDQWCDANKDFDSLRIYHPCSLWLGNGGETYGDGIRPYTDVNNEENQACMDMDCHKHVSLLPISKGIIVTRETMLKQTVYYYSPVFYDYDDEQLRLLYATDIILLGSLNDCDLDGIPQFFRYLESSTYNMPTDLLFTNTDVKLDGNEVVFDTDTEATGCDWGNRNQKDQCGGIDGGLFYGIGCSTIELHTKSCINLMRICELDVSLDETQYIRDLNNSNDTDDAYQLLVADGFVSKDELNGFDSRSMFATMNGNGLKTMYNPENGLKKYDFKFLYPDNFDGAMYGLMKDVQSNGDCSGVSYKHNYNFEQFSKDYYRFRMGEKPFFYMKGTQETPEIIKENNWNSTDTYKRFPRFENSFYFYFGLNAGKTAIDQFNSQFFATCEDVFEDPFAFKIDLFPSDWCNDEGGTIALDFGDISSPYEILLNGVSDTTFSREYKNVTDPKVVIGDVSNVDGNTDYDDYNKTLDMKGLANGTYEAIVTDADGNVVSKEFTLAAPYLSFQLSKLDFRISNNVLLETYGSFSEVRKIKLPPENEGERIKIGGEITVERLSINGEKLTDYTINVKKVRNVPETDENGDFIYNESGEIKTKRVIVELLPAITQDEMPIQCDEGGCEYQVTITQLCNGVESNNTVTKQIKVEEPLPVKLFINGVDYEFIKGFETGWVFDGNSFKKSGNVKGWDRISDTSKDGPYTWPDEYTLPSIEGTEEWNKVMEKRNEVATALKNAVWLTCEESNNKLFIQGQSNFYPITYSLYGVDEDDIEDCEDDVKVTAFSEGNNTTVDNIIIGTLIPDKEDLLNDCKPPYFVGMVDSNSATLPIGSMVLENGSITVEYGNLFGVHFIDKIFKADIVMWAGNNNPVSYYPDGTETEIKEIEPYFGMVRGIIYNGMITGTNKITDGDNEWAETIFNNVSIGTVSPLIITLTTNKDATEGPLTNEDAMPTVRIISTNAPADGKNVFTLPLSDNKEDLDFTAAMVPNYTTSLKIDDDSACGGMEYDLYGGMVVESSDVYNDCIDNTKSRLTVKATGNGDEFTVYTILRVNDDDEDDDKKAFPWLNHNFNSLKSKARNIYHKDVTLDEIIYAAYGDSESTIEKEGENGEIVQEDTTAYGSTGKFVGASYFEPIYIVAVTENNCRQLSPVYDFTPTTCKVFLSNEWEEENTKVEGDASDLDVSGSVNVPLPDSEEGNTVSRATEKVEIEAEVSGTVESEGKTQIQKYKFNIEVKPTDQYYIKNFKSTLSFTCSAIESNPFGTSLEYNPKVSGFKVSYEITKAVFDQLLSADLGSTTLIEITDISGMVSKTKVDYNSDYNQITEADPIDLGGEGDGGE